MLWASLDGDADRLVLFERGRNGGITLADGDRFAVLLARFISHHVEQAKLSCASIGVAQTAYSNGAATKALSDIPLVHVRIAKTGVKNLEREVRLHSVGIYWEPNGHGTVLYSHDFASNLERLHKELEAPHSTEDSTRKEHVAALHAVGKLANQAVGDGVADLLLVLGVLAYQGLSFAQWTEVYDERCSCNLVVRVADKNVVVTRDCDREVFEPVELRAAVRKATEKEGYRAFVRPSGTEDVVRIYAEVPAGRAGDAKQLAVIVARAVYDICGGVGKRV